MKGEIKKVRTLVAIAGTAAILILIAVTAWAIWLASLPRNEVREAMRTLAPAGGSGIKEYRYPSGKVKERAYWSDYEVDCVEYFSVSGDLLFVSQFDDGRSVSITLNDEGEITEIFHTRHFAKTAPFFQLEDGELREVFFINRDGTESHVKVSE